jgi:anti-sigma-K factor RskA
MAAPPVDDHAEEFDQLAGLAALDALEGDDRARFEQHVGQCERCRMTVRLDREALAGLVLTAPEMEPSADFKARLLQRAAQELAERTPAVEEPSAPTRLRPVPPEAEQAVQEPLPPNVIPIWRRRSPWLNAVAAAIVIAVLAVGGYSYQNAPIATVQIPATDGQGTATVIVRRSGASEVNLRGLPDPDPGYLYEAWIIPNGQAPVAAGVGSSGNATIPLDGDPRGSTFALTRERSRVPAPTSPPFLAGPVNA